MAPPYLEPRLLRVVPDGDGGWSIRERRTGQVLGRASTAEAALEEATGMLVGGGGLVQVVDGGDFVIARAGVAPPRAPWPTYVRRASLRLGVALAVGLLAGSLFHFRALPVLIGMALGAQAMNLGQVLAARKAREDARRLR